VYRITPDLALVETTDVITPLVDDPFTYGRIAAANAISDVYAMGGRPVTAMNLVFFPACSLPGSVLEEILRGGQSAMDDAGVCLVGGHTVEDRELKYGLAVTGLIDPGAVVRNNTPRPGDRLLLTKPLGSGIVSTAIKGEFASPAQVAEATSWMTTLNREAAELMVRCGASAATDVTGFGLLGHGCEMAGGGEVSLRLRLDAVPLMDGVATLVGEGMVPAGCYRNRDHFAGRVDGVSVPSDRWLPLFDPQTSGGLLIALPPDGAAEFLRLARERNLFVAEIGQVTERQEHAIVIV
jgi:selenide,water dikinase